MPGAGDPEMGKRILFAREAKGISPETIEDKIGRGKRYLENVEAGREGPGLEALMGIALEVEASLDWLVWGREDVTGPAQRLIDRLLEALSPDQIQFLANLAPEELQTLVDLYELAVIRSRRSST